MQLHHQLRCFSKVADPGHSAAVALATQAAYLILMRLFYSRGAFYNLNPYSAPMKSLKFRIQSNSAPCAHTREKTKQQREYARRIHRFCASGTSQASTLTACTMSYILTWVSSYTVRVRKTRVRGSHTSSINRVRGTKIP